MLSMPVQSPYVFVLFTAVARHPPCYFSATNNNGGIKKFGSALRKCFFIEKAEQKQERGSMQRGIGVILRQFVYEFCETCFDFVNLKKANTYHQTYHQLFEAFWGENREQNTRDKRLLFHAEMRRERILLHMGCVLAPPFLLPHPHPPKKLPQIS